MTQEQLIACLVDIKLEPLLLLPGQCLVHVLVVLLFQAEDFVLVLKEFAFFPLFIELQSGLFELCDVGVVLEPALLGKPINQLLPNLLEPGLNLAINLLLFPGVE